MICVWWYVCSVEGHCGLCMVLCGGDSLWVVYGAVVMSFVATMAMYCFVLQA